ncbi:sigma-70 family RNA polymerase sigma factor [Geminicoccaceae bacterium 1502E]|nr:sigma-70 family RNA polymerase sigma factor [Geminicoccaceae bacterium 1502E]
MSIFREDVVALMPHLRAFARSLTGGNPDLADDLVQDTIVNALQAQAQFQPGTNLKAWLFTILRNRFHSVMTRKHVTAEVEDDDIENKWWTPPYQETAIEIDAFKRAFRRLSPAHREVLVLAGVQALPYEEIARICGCEIGTVKSRVNRARALLKKMLLEGELPVEPERMKLRRRPAEDGALEATPEERRLLEQVGGPALAAGGPGARRLN